MTTYYVAKNGSPSNPGTSAAPWLTIQKAASTLLADDIGYVKQGSYNEYTVPAHSGSANHFIKLMAYPGDTVTIDGKNLSMGSDNDGYVDALIQIGSVHGSTAEAPISYWHIEGFEITNTVTPQWGFGVSIYGACDHIELVNLKIHTVACSGILAQYSWSNTSHRPTNILVNTCDVYDTNNHINQEGISFVGVNGFEIVNTQVHDLHSNGGNGGGLYDYQIAMCLKEGCSNGLVHGCSIYGNHLDGYYVGNNASNIDVYNNKATGGWSGMQAYSEYGGTISNVRFFNSCCWGNTIGYIDVFKADLISNVQLINNTFFQNNEVEIYHYGTASQYSNCVSRNNLIYGRQGTGYQLEIAPNNPALTGLTIDHNLYFNGSTSASTYYSGNVYGTNAIKFVDPKMANPSGQDFTLTVTSPAINAGSTTLAPTTDAAGLVRPQGTAPCIGAYEYPLSLGEVHYLPVLELSRCWSLIRQ